MEPFSNTVLCHTFSSDWSILAVTILIFDFSQSPLGTLMGRSDPRGTKILGDWGAVGEKKGALAFVGALEHIGSLCCVIGA